MNKLILILLALAIMPAFVVAEDSTTKKLIKAKMLKESDDDSVLKKAVKLDAASNIVNDDGDSGLKKAAKLKAMDEMTKED